MYRKTIISCGVAALLTFTSAAAFAQALEVPTSSSSGPTPQGELAPSGGPAPVRAGQPWVGPETVTEADLLAARVEMVPDADGPDPLSPEVAAEIAEGASESIINWDSRLRQGTTFYPNRAIVYITYNEAHLCTGFMLSKNIVATAGHCVHSGGDNGDWYNARLYRVYPGRNGPSSPFGSCGVVKQYSVVGWTVNGNSLYDYGALVLDCSVGNTVGWFGMYSKDEKTAFLGDSAIVSGYPGDKPQTQWLSADQVRKSETLRVCYRMDTIGGHSGSPVWHDRKNALDTTGAWSFAIHAYAAICGIQQNWGPRMTRARVRNFIEWINAN